MRRDEGLVPNTAQCAQVGWCQTPRSARGRHARCGVMALGPPPHSTASSRRHAGLVRAGYETVTAQNLGKMCA